MDTQTKEEIQKLKQLAKKYGKYLTSKDLEEMLRGVSTKDLKSALRKILRKREKGKNQLEIWLETYLHNYFLDNGHFPERKIIRILISKYFNITMKENRKGIKKLPPNIEKTIEKTIWRVRKRIKKEEQYQKQIIDKVLAFEKGLVKEEEVIKTYIEVKNKIPKSTRSQFRSMLIEAGIDERKLP